MQNNGFLSVNLSGLSRPYLEACSDYLNPVLQDFEQFDNYTYFVKTVCYLDTDSDKAHRELKNKMNKMKG